MPNHILVEVSYALPEKQLIIPVKVEIGLTVKDAIEQSGILKEFDGIDLKHNRVGIFGKLTSLNHIIRHRDRIEIYRALIADPKEIRRKRAEAGKDIKKED